MYLARFTVSRSRTLRRPVTGNSLWLRCGSPIPLLAARVHNRTHALLRISWIHAGRYVRFAVPSHRHALVHAHARARARPAAVVNKLISGYHQFRTCRTLMLFPPPFLSLGSSICTLYSLLLYTYVYTLFAVYFVYLWCSRVTVHTAMRNYCSCLWSIYAAYGFLVQYRLSNKLYSDYL